MHRNDTAEEHDPIFIKNSIDFAITNSFDVLPVSYLNRKEGLERYYSYVPEPDVFFKVSETRKNYSVNRKNLVSLIREQYAQAGIVPTGALNTNLNLLLDNGTFTVTTGHQLNLFTGPIYFLYKILTTIKLSEQLTTKGISTVPVYWMASEDHDMDEIRFVSVFGQKIEWKTNWNGASGKSPCTGINDAIEEIRLKLGNSPEALELLNIFSEAYSNSSSLSIATRKLVHELFQKFGLIILDPDSPQLKREFQPIILDDLKNQSAEKLVNETIAELKNDFNIQVHPRNINLFYLTESSRERIVKKENIYSLANGMKQWSETEIIQEATDFPERFSPNVVLRPLYQEKILPNLATIGGPSEIAYWLEYKSMFNHYNIPFPVLILRNCLLIVDSAAMERKDKYGIRLEELFLSADELKKLFIQSNPELSFSVEQYLNKIESEFDRLGEEISSVDGSLKGNVEAERQKLRNGLKTLEEKAIRARKKKHENELNQIQKLKEKLFPNNGLQERSENFASFYLRYGSKFITELYSMIDPFSNNFNILTEIKTKNS